MANILTRMGDGERVQMSVAEVRDALLAGTHDAAQKGKIPELGSDELEQLLEIFLDKNRIVGVAPGEEVVLTHDIGTLRLMGDQANSGVGIPLSRLQGILVHERAFAADTMELGHIDYSFKPVKPIISMEMQEYETAAMMTIVPLFYGAMPNLGTYYRPDGPFGNPSDLLPQGKVREAREAQLEAAGHATRDMVYVCSKLHEVACEGINFDTTAAAGDADFYATLNAVAEIKKTMPEMAIEVGMAGEFILGMHGELFFNGQRLAGMYPHQQVKVVEEAGADIFGPVINTNTSRSMPWNVARAVTFVKHTVDVSSIPIHVNVGMGVGGVPVFETPPIDSTTRASKALVQIAKVDGL